MQNYKTFIGLEIHIQSKTKSKMFCSCSSSYFGADPNTHTCPVCLGLPGGLPSANRKAIENCIKLGIALHCDINRSSKFDRKHYVYPDLSKSYQISQYDLPFCVNGYIEVTGGETDDDKTRVRIKRIHQEEDTAKSIHNADGTVIDYNKSGVALIEVVTEPDFESTAQVMEFARSLQQIVRYLDVSDANMEMGQMRFELNISVGDVDKLSNLELPSYKVECKNISSISILEKVINFEVNRQSELLTKGITPIQETRGIDDITGETYTQRIKEDAEDYRYFPEPDLPNIIISDKWLSDIKETIGILPDDIIYNLLNLGISRESADIIVQDRERCSWFMSLLSKIPTDVEFDKNIVISQLCNFFVGELFAILKKNKVEFSDIKISHQNYLDMILELLRNNISGSTIKNLLSRYIVGESLAVLDYIKCNNLQQISDIIIILPIVKEVIVLNQKAVNDFHAGKIVAKASLVGQVMSRFKGKANPQIIDKLIDQELN